MGLGLRLFDELPCQMTIPACHQAGGLRNRNPKTDILNKKMKVTYSWLKDFVEIKLPPQRLVDKLTMAGLEVKSVEEKDGDFVFEIEITSNRPDWLSVTGIAREVAAITGKKLKSSQVTSHLPVLQAGKPQGKKMRLEKCYLRHFAINIEDKKDCPLYTARVIEGVKVGPSPEWLKKRLELVGCRSINNIVDITNYVLFETGHPLHAFDLDKIVASHQSPVTSQGVNIIVRRAKKGEELTTIDGIKRILDENVLVISSDVKNETGGRRQAAGRLLAIAGIMGGKDTEVTETTKNVLLEAAVFNPVVVRRARQSQGLQSESSYRFERGINRDTVGNAGTRTLTLIRELAGGRCERVVTSGEQKKNLKTIALEVPRVDTLLGVAIQSIKVKRILEALGCTLKAKAKNTFAVAIPSYRQDITGEMDLVEEIARIFGYENIPVSVPALIPQIHVQDQRDIISAIKNVLVGLGLNEAITYSLVDKKLLSYAEQEGVKPVEVLNPLSVEQEVLRTTLALSLSRCVAYNLNQGQEYVSLFEIAKRFSAINNRIQEEWYLAVALSGTKPFWFSQGRLKDEMGLLHVKGILEAIFERLRIKECTFRPEQGLTLVEVLAKKKCIGYMQRLHRDVLDALDIKSKEVFVAELSLDSLLPLIDMKNKFTPLPLYPAISRDISFILKEGIPIDEVVEVIKNSGGPLLREVNITDYYTGRQIPPGHKGLTVSCLYRSDERTLAETEVGPLHSEASRILAEKFEAKLR